jgi:hypothetical protein
MTFQTGVILFASAVILIIAGYFFILPAMMRFLINLFREGLGLPKE